MNLSPVDCYKMELLSLLTQRDRKSPEINCTPKESVVVWICLHFHPHLVVGIFFGPWTKRTLFTMHTVKQKLGSGKLICLFLYLCICVFLHFCIFVFLYFRLVAGGCGGSGESDGAPGSHRWPQIITRIISIFTISTSNNIIVVPISSWVFNWSTAWVWFMYIVHVNMSWQNKVHSENFKSNGLTNMLGAILLLVQKVWSASWFTNQNDDTIVLMFVILIRGGVYGSIELNYWFRSHLPDSLPDELLVATTIKCWVENITRVRNWNHNSLCDLFVFLSGHHTDQISEGSQKSDPKDCPRYIQAQPGAAIVIFTVLLPSQK